MHDRCTTDQYNLCNISSAEIPPLDQSLVQWLHTLSDDQLALQGIDRSEIDDGETYRRPTLGDYFQNQYTAIAAGLHGRGLTLHEFRNCTVNDVVDDPTSGCVWIRFGDDASVVVDRVVIATGHSFHQPNEPEHGYFSSPWPMQKLIPARGQCYNFEIGLLGELLSAFDVPSSLSHRHGAFVDRDDTLVYEPFSGTDGFRVVLHSAEGWLPHLQYEQTEPFRTGFCHVDRDTMLALRDDRGVLSLNDYFDHVCCPAPTVAVHKGQRADIVLLLASEETTLEALVERMSEEHTADDPFALVRSEMRDAERSLRKGIPIHWKETLDALMYTLNFHSDLRPAEDHLRYRQVVMPFLMNVIAAMPLHSASIMLALHDADRLELIRGRVTIKDQRNSRTSVAIENGDSLIERSYQMFVNCSGHGGLSFDAYPFKSLTAAGTVSEAVVHFREEAASAHIPALEADNLVHRDGRTSVRSGGVAIDGYYRLVGRDGSSNAGETPSPHVDVVTSVYEEIAEAS